MKQSSSHPTLHSNGQILHKLLLSKRQVAVGLFEQCYLKDVGLICEKYFMFLKVKISGNAEYRLPCRASFLLHGSHI